MPITEPVTTWKSSKFLLEANFRPKQAKHLLEDGEIQNRNTRMPESLSDSRGPIRHLSLHPCPPNLKEDPIVQPQVSKLPVHAYSPLQGNQTQLEFGQLAYQGSVPNSLFFVFIWGFTSLVQVISQRVLLWAEETNTYSWSRFCTVNCQPSVIPNSHYRWYLLR